MSNIWRPSVLPVSDLQRQKQLLARLKSGLIEKNSMVCLDSELTKTTTQQPHTVSSVAESKLIDQDALNRLMETKTINWCRNVQTMSTLRNESDVFNPRTSVLRAVAISLWCLGDEETVSFLGRLLHVTLTNPPVQQSAQFQSRWRTDGDVIRADSIDALQPTETDWQTVSTAFREDNKNHQGSAQLLCSSVAVSLEAVHVFALANVIQRPIVLLPVHRPSSSVGSTATDLSGIYLPVLHDPSTCCHSPLALVISPTESSVVLPLAFSDVTSVAGVVKPEQAIPLVGSDLAPLPVRCLLPNETPEVLLQSYLRITELSHTSASGVTMIPVAGVDIVVPDMMAAFLTASATDKIPNTDRHVKVHADPASVDRQSPVLSSGLETGRCSTPGCEFFGLKQNNWKCSACCMKELGIQTTSQQETATQPASQLYVQGLVNTSTTHVVCPAEVTSCAVPNCNHPVAVSSRSYCLEHGSRESGHLSVGRAGSWPLESARLKPLVVSEAGTPCVVAGCEMYGQPEREGLCSQHFLTRLPAAHATPLSCKNPTCIGEGLKVNNGFCARCYAVQPHQYVSALQQPTSAINSSSLPSATLPVSENLLEQSPRHGVATSARCIMDFCSNFGSDDCKGLCSECFTILCQRRLGPGNDDVLVTEPRKKCITDGCQSLVGMEDILCSDCYRKQEQALKDMNM